MKFEEIVKRHKDSIYGWWRDSIDLDLQDWMIDLRKQERYLNTVKEISLNDLLSPESWFLQACKWKRDNWYDDDWLMWKYGNNWEPLYRTYMREHHAMMLSILSQEEKIKYIKENVIVE